MPFLLIVRLPRVVRLPIEFDDDVLRQNAVPGAIKVDRDYLAFAVGKAPESQITDAISSHHVVLSDHSHAVVRDYRWVYTTWGRYTTLVSNEIWIGDTMVNEVRRYVR